MDISVIICAHNPRTEYLQRSLDALRAQSLPTEQWELILVDNASREPLAQTWDLSWHPRARHVLKQELGLSAARQCGMREAASDLWMFVDDDNLLDRNYLSEAVSIKREWPRLGTWGSGAIVPEFEIRPAASLLKMMPYLALREVKGPFWCNFPRNEAFPWGAGLCLRKSIADAYCKLSLESNIVIPVAKVQRCSAAMTLSCPMSHAASGWVSTYFPQLKLTHLIPKDRISQAYLLSVLEGTGISNVLLAYKWIGFRPKTPLSVRGSLSILKNLLLRRGIDREMYLANVCATLKALRVISAAGASNRVKVPA